MPRTVRAHGGAQGTGTEGMNTLLRQALPRAVWWLPRSFCSFIKGRLGPGLGTWLYRGARGQSVVESHFSQALQDKALLPTLPLGHGPSHPKPGSSSGTCGPNCNPAQGPIAAFSHLTRADYRVFSLVHSHSILPAGTNASPGQLPLCLLTHVPSTWSDTGLRHAPNTQSLKKEHVKEEMGPTQTLTKVLWD